MARTKTDTPHGRGTGVPDPIDVRFGATVRRIRRMRGISQPTLAKALGISFQAVQKYETGENRVAVSTLVHIAGVLDVSPAALLADVEAGGQPIEGTFDRRTVELARDAERLDLRLQQSLRRFVRDLAAAQRPEVAETAKRSADDMPGEERKAPPAPSQRRRAGS